MEYSYEQSVKYESFFVLAFYVDEVTLRHVHIQGWNTTKKTMMISPFIAAKKIAGIYWVIFSCFNSVYSPILFKCWYYDYITETTNQLAKIEN